MYMGSNPPIDKTGVSNESLLQDAGERYDRIGVYGMKGEIEEEEEQMEKMVGARQRMRRRKKKRRKRWGR